jgi:hypothetical protein
LQWIQGFRVSRHSLLNPFEKSSSHEYQIYGKTESLREGNFLSGGKKGIIIPQIYITRELGKSLGLTKMLLDIKKKSLQKKCGGIDISWRERSMVASLLVERKQKGVLL